ncbi:hypothetical protein Ocin01_10962, partial [Orchesella cincta]
KLPPPPPPPVNKFSKDAEPSKTNKMLLRRMTKKSDPKARLSSLDQVVNTGLCKIKLEVDYSTHPQVKPEPVDPDPLLNTSDIMPDSDIEEVGEDIEDNHLADQLDNIINENFDNDTVINIDKQIEENMDLDVFNTLDSDEQEAVTVKEELDIQMDVEVEEPFLVTEPLNRSLTPTDLPETDPVSDDTEDTTPVVNSVQNGQLPSTSTTESISKEAKDESTSSSSLTPSSNPSLPCTGETDENSNSSGALPLTNEVPEKIPELGSLPPQSQVGGENTEASQSIPPPPPAEPINEKENECIFFGTNTDVSPPSITLNECSLKIDPVFEVPFLDKLLKKVYVEVDVDETESQPQQNEGAAKTRKRKRSDSESEQRRSDKLEQSRLDATSNITTAAIPTMEDAANDGEVAKCVVEKPKTIHNFYPNRANSARILWNAMTETCTEEPNDFFISSDESSDDSDSDDDSEVVSDSDASTNILKPDPPAEAQAPAAKVDPII